MASQCHSVVRAPAIRVTRLDSCGVPTDSACSYATNTCFATIALTKVMQDRQDALGLNANGDICYDVPKAPILRWYEVVLTLRNVDPELFNIVSGEPLVLNNAVSPIAIGYDTVVGSVNAANFALEFWTGTDDANGCSDGTIDYGYGVLPWLYQGVIGDVTIQNGGVDFTVTAISKASVNWGVGPYNVQLSDAAATLGQPFPLFTTVNGAHKRFQWTEMAPPLGLCGCNDLTPTVTVTPLAAVAATPRVLTFPLGTDGLPLLPAYITWGDATPAVLVTSGTSLNHTYAIGSYTALYKPVRSSPTYSSATITAS